MSHVPPNAVRRAATKALEWRREFGRGGTAVGVARARDLANGRAVSDETIGRMRSYFARHAVDSQAVGFFRGEEGFPTAGRIAWDLWGGDAGERWVNSLKHREMRDEPESELAALFVATGLRYPRTSGRGQVGDLVVRAHVPNLSSIDGYFAESKTLPGIRVVSMSDLGGPRSVFYAADDFARSERLAEAIRVSGEINPLIIGVDEKGAFIIEGAHRFVALYYLKAKEFPAVVVVGKD